MIPIYLLWNNRLPKRAELDALTKSLRAQRELPQQVVDFLDGMVGDSPDDVGQIGLRIEAVHLVGLCRAPNYAERARFSSKRR